MSAKEIINLEKKFGPVLLPAFFWIVVLIAVISGMKLITTGGPLLGILVLVGVPALARIICEVLLSIFEINSQLKVQK
jgi:hypothetical protein